MKSFFYSLIFLVVFFSTFSSCNKIKDLFKKEEKVYVLDSITRTYEYVNSTSTCNTQVNNTYYKYNLDGICDTVINYSVYSGSFCPPNRFDTTIYRKSGNIIYGKAGVNGTLTQLGTLNTEGYLISTKSTYSQSLMPRNILGVQYVDTIGSGLISWQDDDYGNSTNRVIKNYSVFHQGNSYPITRTSNISETTSTSNYQEGDLIQAQSISVQTGKNFTRACSTCPWNFSSYLTTSPANTNLTLTRNNLYLKTVDNYFYTTIQAQRPSFFWNYPASNIARELQNISSYSVNGGVSFTNYLNITNVYTRNHVLEDGLIKSFERLSYLSNSTTLSAIERNTYHYHLK